MSALDNLAPALALLLDAALKATVVLLGALAATRLMRRRTAAARHLVWVVALAGVLALPALAAVLPAWKALPLPAFLRPVPTAPAPSVDPAHPALREHAGTDAPAPHPAEAASESSAPLSSSPSSSFVPTESGRAPLPFDWRMALLAVWGIGGGLLLARLAYGLARVAWIERRATEITDEAWVGITDRLTRRLRVGRMVTLLREAHASVPMTWGIVRPVVLLPAEADAWDDERRTVVLAHELAHVRRWDTATQWIAHLALAVFWFHPLVWTAARRMREERERACDDAVLALGTRPVRYADHLLDIVRSLGQSEGPAAALAMARRSQFEGRLLAILDGATPRGGVSRGLGLAALAVAAIAVVPLAALRAAEPAIVEPRGESPRVEAALSARPADERSEATDPPASVRVQPMGSTFGTATRDAVDAPEGDVDGVAAFVPPAAALPVMEVKAATVGREQGIDAGKAATLLRSLQEGDDPVLDVIRAAEGIRSPEERARVLKAVVERRGLRAPTVAAALRAAGRIPTPTLRRNVLTAAAAHQNLDDLVVRRAFFEATAGIDQETERRNVLFAVLERQAVSAEMQLAVIQAGRLPTSVERRNVLFRVMEMPLLPARVASAVIASAAEMKESTERRNVLMRLLERADLPQAQLVELIGSVEEMSASTDQRTVLMRVAERPLTPRAREAYVRAAGKIDTGSDRALVLQALLERHPAAASQRAAAAPASGDGRQVMIWNATEERIHGEGSGARTVRIRAKDVLFGSAYWDVRGFQPGGFLRVEESIGGRTRRVDVRPGGGGRIERSWTVDGQSRAYDSDAEQFLRRIIGEPAPK
ncbi:MAG TPA: M56 family metallopeptidase [Longimicrobium sp.]|nr:M56 family metallopeptidase [Longimicrobium sp.]